MIVVDASAMVEMLMQTEIGLRVRTLVLHHGSSRHAPHLLDVEVVQVLRRFVRSGIATPDRAQQALEDLAAFPIRRHGHVSVIGRAFALRDNLSAYDAVYLALAEALDATLVTCDSALAKVPGSRARVELVA
jgi:predicted nucleic acid-binding protein